MARSLDDKLVKIVRCASQTAGVASAAVKHEIANALENFGEKAP